MPAVLGNLIIILILIGVVALAVRSMVKARKEGGHCTGNCASCGGCGGSTGANKKTHR